MGTLFAIDVGVKGCADAMFVLNPPLALRVTQRLLVTPLKVYTGRIYRDDVWTNAAVSAYSISQDFNLLHYLRWPMRYIELFAEIWKTRPKVGRLTIPVKAFYSLHDEMVSPRSMKLFSDLPMAEIITLSGLGHYYYTSTDKERIGNVLAYSLSNNFLPRGVR